MSVLWQVIVARLDMFGLSILIALWTLKNDRAIFSALDLLVKNGSKPVGLDSPLVENVSELKVLSSPLKDACELKVLSLPLATGA